MVYRVGQNAADQLEDFFSVDPSAFSAIPNESWLAFATQTAREIAVVIPAMKDKVALLSILGLIGERRADFARQFQDESIDGAVGKFGVLRDGAYDMRFAQAAAKLSSLDAVKGQLSKRGLDPNQINYQIRTATTLFVSESQLNRDIFKNLEASAAVGAGVRTGEVVDAQLTEMLSEHVKTRIKISPSDFFSRVRYSQFAFQDLDDRSGQTELTRFYVPLRTRDAFILAEHPTPLTVASILTDRAQAAFEKIIELRGKPDYLGAVARLLWLCFQLMPYRRGSASIITIFGAALLLSASVEPRRHKGARLDVDAMSLPRELFVENFLSAYQ